MPKLDVYGDIQAAVIAFYFPILILTLVYTARYGFSRDAGWTFLFTFSVGKMNRDHPVCISLNALCHLCLSPNHGRRTTRRW
jgi:hypothetical protein